MIKDIPDKRKRTHTRQQKKQSRLRPIYLTSRTLDKLKIRTTIEEQNSKYESIKDRLAFVEIANEEKRKREKRKLKR